MTQPAVSQQIRALELQLGERLIERGRGGFALTEAGRLLLVHADALYERLQLAETQLVESSDEARKALRIGAFPSALSTLVVPAVARLGGSGALQVTVVQGGADDLAAAVRDGSVHVALCFQDGALDRREHEEARRTDLLDEPMLAAVGPDHRLAGRKRVRLSELAGDPWLTSAPDGLIVRACAAAGFEPRIAFLTNDPLAIDAFVESGMAVTLVAQLLAAQLRGIAALDIAGAAVRRAIYALTPHGGRHALVDPFLDAVRAAAAP